MISSFMFALGTERIHLRLKPAFVGVRNLFDLVQTFKGFVYADVLGKSGFYCLISFKLFKGEIT